MEIYEAILKRKSIRKYTEEKIDSKILAKIREYIDLLKPLYSDMTLNMMLIENKNMQQYFENIGSIKAPYYIAITSRKQPWFGENAGFMGEKLIAFLTTIGIGTCWLGTLKPKDSVFEFPYVISIAFGYAEDNLFRENLEHINRKSMGEICLKNSPNDYIRELVQAIRIAPSGINRQPWQIEPDTGKIHFFCEQPSFLTPVNSDNLKGLMPGSILKKMQGVSCGAAISHVQICASHYGRNVTFSRFPEHENSYKKLTYLLTVILE